MSHKPPPADRPIFGTNTISAIYFHNFLKTFQIALNPPLIPPLVRGDTEGLLQKIYNPSIERLFIIRKCFLFILPAVYMFHLLLGHT
jgi:hypothetical protein